MVKWETDAKNSTDNSNEYLLQEILQKHIIPLEEIDISFSRLQRDKQEHLTHRGIAKDSKVSWSRKLNSADSN